MTKIITPAGQTPSNEGDIRVGTHSLLIRLPPISFPPFSLWLCQQKWTAKPSYMTIVIEKYSSFHLSWEIRLMNPRGSSMSFYFNVWAGWPWVRNLVTNSQSTVKCYSLRHVHALYAHRHSKQYRTNVYLLSSYDVTAKALRHEDCLNDVCEYSLNLILDTLPLRCSWITRFWMRCLDNAVP